MGTGKLCRVPQAAVRHGKARQSSGKGQCGDCIRYNVGTGSVWSVFGKKSVYLESRDTRSEVSPCG